MHPHQSPQSTSSSNKTVLQSSATGVQATGGSSLLPGTNRRGVGPNTSPTTTSSTNSLQHIFLLVAAGSDFRLAQIRVESLTTYAFFCALREQYNNLRPFFRKWLSAWTYSHCDFYQVRSTFLTTSPFESRICEVVDIIIVRQIRIPQLRAQARRVPRRET